MSWVALHYRFIIAFSHCYLQEQGVTVTYKNTLTVTYLIERKCGIVRLHHCVWHLVMSEGWLCNLDVEQEELVYMIIVGLQIVV